MGNFVKISREIENWKFYRKAGYAHLFQHLIRKAQWKARFNINGQEIKRGELDYSLRQLADETGLGKQAVGTILKNLEKSGEIKTVKKSKNKHELSVISITNYDVFQNNNDEQDSNQYGSKTEERRNQDNFKKEKKEKKEKNIVPAFCSEVVDYLNQVAGTKYKASSKETQRLIRARYNNDFILEDFKTVINTKSAQWKGDDKMESFLRPQTLFGTKFESYLNEKPKQTKEQKDAEFMALFDKKGE